MRSAVIGGGIIGVNCALALQQLGARVTIFDPGPAQGASKGNAGCFAFSEVTPIAMPGLLRKVPAMLRDRDGPLAVRWTYLPKLAPWLLKFIGASSQPKVERIADALAALARRAEADYEPVLAKAGLVSHVAHKGALFVFSRPPALAASQGEWRMKAARDVGFETLDGSALRSLEPALGPRTIGGYHVPGWSHTLDPFALTRGLLDLFLRQGGHLRNEAVNAVQQDEHGVRIGSQSGCGQSFDGAVIASGAQSSALCEGLGIRLPLDTERGYNTTLPRPGVELSRPVCVVESGYFMTPMAMGLRVGGGVELGGLSLPANWKRVDVMLQDAARALPGLNVTGGGRWMGFRPSMPDSLPVIGRAPRFPRILLAFGHGHLGLTFGATTGRLIAELAVGSPSSLDLQPYAAERFY